MQWICQGCDLLLEWPEQHGEHVLCCPRCHTRLVDTRPVRFQWILALSLSGLLLYMPAIFLPFISLNILGQRNAVSVFGSIVQLYEAGFMLISVLILICAMVAPLLILLFGPLICWACQAVTNDQLFGRLLRVRHYVQEWSMLDVYCLGVVVSYIKLKDLGDVHTFTGALCFVLMMLCSLKAAALMDHAMIWLKRTTGGANG